MFGYKPCATDGCQNTTYMGETFCTACNMRAAQEKARLDLAAHVEAKKLVTWLELQLAFEAWADERAR